MDFLSSYGYSKPKGCRKYLNMPLKDDIRVRFAHIDKVIVFGLRFFYVVAIIF